MAFVPAREQLSGLSYQVASLYGMPHLGCRYEGGGVDATALEDGARCAVCGKAGRPMNCHHEPPRGRGGTFLLCTPMGRFVLRPALIALCGSGTTGCHGDRHNRLFSVRWEWDSDEWAGRWWGGWFLSHGYRPHDPRLFGYGRYVFEGGGMEWGVRP